MTEPDAHLSDTLTLWSVVQRAHHGTPEVAAAAREQLLHLYREPVFRYLLGATRNADVAEELFQDFALRFLRGDFRRADPQHGRFRAYIKTALFRQVAEHFRQQQKQYDPLSAGLVEDLADDTALNLPDSEEAFQRSWRDGLLLRAWDALARFEEQTGQPVYTVLRFRVEHPALRSPIMAEQLSARLGKPMTAVAGRQALHRAREKFSDLLLAEVALTIEEPTTDRLAQELLDLGLLEYCRPALERLGWERPGASEVV